MSHQCRLSFANINFLSPQIAEVIVDNNVTISLEMAEEYERFLNENFSSNFGLLINKINHYDYAYEAKLSIASSANIKAMAVVTYAKADLDKTNNLMEELSLIHI